MMNVQPFPQADSLYLRSAGKAQSQHTRKLNDEPEEMSSEVTDFMDFWHHMY
jgi:hypothetical protein